MRRMCVGLICLVLPVAAAIAQSPPPAAAPPDSEIRRILIDRIDTQKQGVGIVVGLSSRADAASSLMAVSRRDRKSVV